jgi:hypothetical protein
LVERNYNNRTNRAFDAVLPSNFGVEWGGKVKLWHEIRLLSGPVLIPERIGIARRRPLVSFPVG